MAEKAARARHLLLANQFGGETTLFSEKHQKDKVTLKRTVLSVMFRRADGGTRQTDGPSFQDAESKVRLTRLNGRACVSMTTPGVGREAPRDKLKGFAEVATR